MTSKEARWSQLPTVADGQVLKAVDVLTDQLHRQQRCKIGRVCTEHTHLSTGHCNDTRGFQPSSIGRAPACVSVQAMGAAGGCSRSSHAAMTTTEKKAKAMAKMRVAQLRPIIIPLRSPNSDSQVSISMLSDTACTLMTVLAWSAQ